jgi:hypothetical protein
MHGAIAATIHAVPARSLSWAVRPTHSVHDGASAIPLVLHPAAWPKHRRELQRSLGLAASSATAASPRYGLVGSLPLAAWPTSPGQPATIKPCSPSALREALDEIAAAQQPDAEHYVAGYRQQFAETSPTN